MTAGENATGPTPARAAGGGIFPAAPREPAAVILAADIVRWLIPAVGKMPKTIRFGLGSRLEAAMLDVLDGLITAQYARGPTRAAALGVANGRLQVARHLARMGVELNAFSPRQGVYLAGQFVALGRQVGAWSKASGSTANSSGDSAIPDG